MTRIVYAGMETDVRWEHHERLEHREAMSRLTVLIVGAVLVASAVPGAVAAVPPCNKLLTLQDVTRAVGPGFKAAGFKAPPPEAAAVLGSRGCFYHRSSTDQAGHDVEEDVWLIYIEIPGGAAPQLAETSNGYKLSGAPVVAASALGPGAFYTTDPATKERTLVFFGKGNLYLQLVYKVGKQLNPKAALALAKIVYARL